MPGTVIIKPLKANLINNNQLFPTMNPYCSVSLGNQEVNSQACRNSNQNPEWSDSLILKRSYEPSCVLKIKDKEWFKSDDTVGVAEINIQEIEAKGRVNQWYKVYHNDQPVGEILVEAVFSPDASGVHKQTTYQQNYAQSTSINKDFGQSLYPSSIYSPAKQTNYDQRLISQVPLSQIPGLDYSHQVTLPHMSHNLTSQEYHKLHSRQNERYQPVRRIIGDQEVPPSWEGYKTREWLIESPKDKNNENLTGSTLATTPDRYQPFASPRPETTPTELSYYPTLGGIKYAPSQQGQAYQPIYQVQKSNLSPVHEKAKINQIESPEGFQPTKLINRLQEDETERPEVL